MEKNHLSIAMKIAKIAFIVLVITQAVPILLLGMGSINQIAVALFPDSKTTLLFVLVTCEVLVLMGMVALVVYRVKKLKQGV